MNLAVLSVQTRLLLRSGRSRTCTHNNDQTEQWCAVWNQREARTMRRAGCSLESRRRSDNHDATTQL